MVEPSATQAALKDTELQCIRHSAERLKANVKKSNKLFSLPSASVQMNRWMVLWVASPTASSSCFLFQEVHEASRSKLAITRRHVACVPPSLGIYLLIYLSADLPRPI